MTRDSLIVAALMGFCALVLLVDLLTWPSKPEQEEPRERRPAITARAYGELLDATWSPVANPRILGVVWYDDAEVERRGAAFRLDPRDRLLRARRRCGADEPNPVGWLDLVGGGADRLVGEPPRNRTRRFH